MTDPIASRRNPLVRRIRKLDTDPDSRQREGLYLLWGARQVQEAMGERSGVAQLVIGERIARQTSLRSLLRLARERAIPVAIFADPLLEELSPGASDQGMLVLARMRRAPLASLLSGPRPPLLLVADRIRDPGNLGALVRLAEAASASALVTVPGTADPYNTRAARASAGSILRVTLADLPSPEEWKKIRIDYSLRVVVTLAREGTPPHRMDLRGPVALVVGNEGEGISGEWVESADLKATIHLGGSVESLNVVSAAAILLYEIFRQRAGS